MKLNFNLGEKFRRLSLLLVCLIVLTFQSDMSNLKAIPMNNYEEKMVIEELRLKVPSQYKEVWLKTEKKIWEPWL